MTGDVELLTRDLRWRNFVPGISPLAFMFTGVEASGALSRDESQSCSFIALKRVRRFRVRFQILLPAEIPACILVSRRELCFRKVHAMEGHRNSMR